MLHAWSWVGDPGLGYPHRPQPIYSTDAEEGAYDANLQLNSSTKIQPSGRDQGWPPALSTAPNRASRFHPIQSVPNNDDGLVPPVRAPDPIS